MTADRLPGLDVERVTAWITANVEQVRAPIQFSIISGGHSNITYGARDDGGRRLVLRRPPLGNLPPGAHDVAREHKILAALGPTSVPVAPVVGLCTDNEVTGAPFYVMDWVDGSVVSNPGVAQSALTTAEARRRASEQVIDVLVALHQIDIDAVGLGDLARREGFLDRQLHRMIGVWERTKTREVALVADLHTRLATDPPRQVGVGIVHNDYRLGNLMLTDDGTVAAVLDWELCTLGDVLADVGYLLNNWQLPEDDEPHVWMEVPPTMAGGFSSHDELIARYVAKTGADIADIEYYRAFSHWRMAIIAEGMKRRYESATMADTNVDFGHLTRRVLDMLALADRHLTASGR
ncbi:MAG: phosphotransferase family protein [Acidimicrobiia bacterium]